AADPGVVQTNILREVPSLLSLLAHFVLKHLGLLQSPEYGVSSIIDAALAPPGTSGAYFFGGIGRTIEPSILSRDAGLALKLWETTSLLQQYSILVALSHVIWVIVHGDRLLRFKIPETSLKPSFSPIRFGGSSRVSSSTRSVAGFISSLNSIHCLNEVQNWRVLSSKGGLF
ncbi:hypothetical protein HN51_018175, partial [Arachis hypogaea]